jgi:hypothetical protein
MVDDIDIWRLARQVIAAFDDCAEIHATTREHRLLELGDVDGAAVWRRVLEAIQTLKADKTPDGMVPH